jgi:hypothetical protein
MEVVQRGRTLWVQVQHHVKMLMTADISSAAMIKSGSKVLQNVSTLSFQHSAIPKHPPRVSNCPCLSLAVGWLSKNGNNDVNPHTITYYNQSGPVLLTCVPSALASFMPLPSSADTLCTLSSARLYSTQ